MIKVVNQKSFKGKGISIMRGASPLANPFVISKKRPRKKVISLYETWLEGCVRARNKIVVDELKKLKELSRKGDLNLICCCKPKECHGDVIVRCLEWMK